MLPRRALITGVTGQDGAYLSQLLLDRGYEVHGLIREIASADVTGSRLRWLGIGDEIEFHNGDLIDLSSLIRVLQEVRPTEIYNLAAQSFVASSWQQPILTGAVTGLGATNLPEAVRMVCSDARFYQASSSPTVAECLGTPANAIGTPLGPTMRGTANSFFGERSNGRSRRRRKSERRPRRLPPSRLGPFSPEYAKCSGLLGVFPLCSKRT